MSARWINRLAWLLCWFAMALPAHAHKPSDSYLALDVRGAQVTGQWDIALRDLDFAIGLDQDGDGKLTWDEIRARHAAIAAYALDHLTLTTAHGPCTVQAGEQLIDHHTDGAYSVLRFTATCPAAVTTLDLGYRLFADVDPQHKGLLRLTHEGTTSTAIFDPQHARQTLAVAAPDRWRQFATYIKEGVWHIWIGYDHILFLLSLLLPAVLLAPPANNLRGAFIDVLKVVTAFTLAHSLTLTLASLSLIALPSRLVESAIAASVVLAAVNNIYPLFRTRRPVAAFVFGLIHGFGFASVLGDLGLPQGALLASLLGFNLGVELGQLCIVAVFLPVAYLLRHTRFYRGVLTGGSALIALLALAWLAERAFDISLMGA
jgi:HupE / UreJ protein